MAGDKPLARARGQIASRILDMPGHAKDRLASSERVRRFAYELRNRRLFADLFQHDRMLADEVRIEAYWEGLSKHISEGDVVIDLGTGSGVLALFAARQGAHVHAIEHGPIIEAAEAVARDNGISNITFHQINSRRLELDEKADAIIHEQIGDALFDEQVVANIADLRDRLLKPGGRIYPSKLRLYIEPVTLSEDMRSPYAWQQKDLHGLDFSSLEAYAATQGHGYRYRLFRPFPFGQFLCEPEAVVSVDLHTANASDLPKRISYERTATRDGFLDGFCVYFEAGFDDQLWFTSSPAEKGTSWATPFLRVASRPVEAGETIRFDLTAEDLADPSSWDWPDA
jgi:protein arginine N-methyltransferase 1